MCGAHYNSILNIFYKYFSRKEVKFLLLDTETKCSTDGDTGSPLRPTGHVHNHACAKYCAFLELLFK